MRTELIPIFMGRISGSERTAISDVGGWADLKTAEDHDLWGRLRRTGVRLLSSAQLQVVTSGRRVGRAPNGFAGALAAHNAYGSCRMSLAAQFRRLLEDGRLNLPFPGLRRHRSRHCELAQIARDNLELGRLVEAHADALAILHEAGREPKPASSLRSLGIGR